MVGGPRAHRGFRRRQSRHRTRHRRNRRRISASVGALTHSADVPDLGLDLERLSKLHHGCRRFVDGASSRHEHYDCPNPFPALGGPKSPQRLTEGTIHLAPGMVVADVFPTG